jgi:hypothetical protein
MEIHIGSCGRPPKSSSLAFPFVLLPQAIAEDFRGHIKRHFLSATLSSQRPSGHDWDWSRLDEVELLRPHITHFGRDGWFGYYVLEFPNISKVVLESSLKGNATYVVGANWRELISLTKPEIRQGAHLRVFHTGNYWRRRVERALSQI